MEPNSNDDKSSDNFESVDLKPAAINNNNNDEEVPSSPTSGDSLQIASTSSSSIKMGPPEEWKDDDEDDQPKPPSMSGADMSSPDENGDDNNNDDVESQNDGVLKPPAKKKKGKKKPQINPKFKDVQETGKWGEMSKKEFIIAIAVFLLVIIAVVLVVVFVVVLPNNEDSGNSGESDVSYVPAPTPPPTMPPTQLPVESELALVLDTIGNSPVTASLIQDGGLSDDALFYQGLVDNASATPQQKAMSWLLYQDELKDPAQSVMRFAFASIYFQNGGPSWATSEGWLTSAQLCDWDHINCDSRNVMQEVDFSEQNLSGELATELAMLGEDLQSILMSRNNLSGQIPGDVIAALPRLGLLYLDNNILTGGVPEALVADARLHTLYVQSNQLTGEWPAMFCMEGTSLMDFGLDCDQLACDPQCCTPLQCYYSS